MAKILILIKNHKRVLAVGALVLVIGSFGLYRILAKPNKKPIYQTARVEQGTFVKAITASGTVTAGSSNEITTKASGVVKRVFIKNGETVKKGQKIAELALDDEAQSRATIAYAAYIEAVNAVKTAEKNKVTADIKMWQDRENYLNALENQDYKNNNSVNPETKKDYTEGEKTIIDKSVEEARLAFAASETAYQNADTQINKAKALMADAWREYQNTAATIVAPVDGVVTNFTLAPGITVVASPDTSASAPAGSVSAQKLGLIVNPNAQYQVSVALSEMDVTQVNPDQKVTLTLDAFPDKTLTGKILSIDTTGKITSGVTSYPAVILVDPTELKLYPNMAVNAKILVKVEDNVLLAPSSAIQNTSGNQTVRVMKNGKLTTVPVEIGDANETQTIIKSGLNEGDEVVIGTITPQNTSSNRSNTVFGGLSGSRNFGGSFRIMTR